MSADLVMEAVPEAVLGVRPSASAPQSDIEVLIKWKALPDFEATWEDYTSLFTLFPSFHLEDKVAVWEGGNATSRARPPIRIKNLVIEELKQYFKPEFLNRLDDMIVFRKLTKLEVKEIADIMLKEVFRRLETKGINIQVTESFTQRVVEDGYSPSYGARPLRRAIMRLLEDSMAEKMLAREIQEGDSVILDVDSSGNVIVLNSSNNNSSLFSELLPV
ncbi:chaperone protein ClpC, chloroplastic-like [Beta vulgaris subsp. vulgaris]|uniref:chaperone protein ClpC, chloroplastic-like n=1 Tax=Beta vulgaris subsp. vulgaris TaxID=3555 RepID=UPI0025484E55|nr:chaperone protein ClpC, chloroplastic-like [Beta vulgaris subsp. vulgaris]